MGSADKIKGNVSVPVGFSETAHWPPPTALMFLLSVGFDNYVVANRVTAIVHCTSAPVRRMIQEFRANGRLLDATQGRRMRALLLLDDGCLVASALTPETLARRLARPGVVEPEGEE